MLSSFIKQIKKPVACFSVYTRGTSLSYVKCTNHHLLDLSIRKIVTVKKYRVVAEYIDVTVGKKFDFTYE